MKDFERIDKLEKDVKYLMQAGSHLSRLVRDVINNSDNTSRMAEKVIELNNKIIADNERLIGYIRELSKYVEGSMSGTTTPESTQNTSKGTQ